MRKFLILGIAILFLVAILFVPGGYALQYEVAFWSKYFKGVETQMPFLTAAILAVPLSEIVYPMFFVTWIASYIL